MAAPPRTSLPRLLTADEVCDQFQSIGRHRLYQLARRGQIPVVRLGTAYRFSVFALEAWIAAGGTTPDSDLTPPPAPGPGDLPPGAEVDR